MNKESIKGGGEWFIDRRKVRILLCDNDSKSSQEISSLLLKCSYQVTSVKSPRQVIDALNAEGPDIDIILAEVNLPMTKGIKMLKYIARDKKFRRIPVIMMSAQDEVSIVVKCLRLGAADYLVKPLRTNELLNLWTHMWRRRRMLGLAEKDMTYEFDLVASDPSDANTNSTTLFSDDTDDKSRRSANLENGMSNHHEDEATAVAFWPFSDLPESRHTMTSNSQTEQLFSGPKKSELKIGESSAFFTYVKSNIPKKNSQGFAKVDTRPVQFEDGAQACGQLMVNDTYAHVNGETWELSSQGDDFPSSGSIRGSSTPPMSAEYPNFKRDKFSRSGNESHCDESVLPAEIPYPYYQVMTQSSAQLYQKNLHTNLGMLPRYNNFPQCPSNVPSMTTPFPYYPLGMCLQPGQMPPNNYSWPTTFGGSASSPADAKINKVDRREAALMKFRQKRKERCFDKKIRYVNRKHLVERRPRVRGQFVRKVNGINVDLNGQPASAEDDENDLLRDYSPEDYTSEC